MFLRDVYIRMIDRVKECMTNLLDHKRTFVKIVPIYVPYTYINEQNKCACRTGFCLTSVCIHIRVGVGVETYNWMDSLYTIQTFSFNVYCRVLKSSRFNVTFDPLHNSVMSIHWRNFGFILELMVILYKRITEWCGFLYTRIW